MPHIHTGPGQHDMTVSAYIIRRREDGAWLCLMHMHRKIDKLMQIGGHIELQETPWQAVVHEILEESGYSLDELIVLQSTEDRVDDSGNVTHPVPFSVNTHLVGGLENDHYHSDMCFGFEAQDIPNANVSENESIDLRWLTLRELDVAAQSGEALKDVYFIYKFLLSHYTSYAQVPATSFSLREPTNTEITYKR